jgi:circadian clock protein KaiB
VRTPKHALKAETPDEYLTHAEEALASQHYILQLYVTGSSVRSSRAITNIHSLCEERLKDRYELEVIDIYQQPEHAMDQQIIAAPTLIKREPLPLKRLVGDFSNRDRVIHGLDLAT